MYYYGGYQGNGNSSCGCGGSYNTGYAYPMYGYGYGTGYGNSAKGVSATSILNKHEDDFDTCSLL